MNKDIITLTKKQKQEILYFLVFLTIYINNVNFIIKSIEYNEIFKLQIY